MDATLQILVDTITAGLNGDRSGVRAIVLRLLRRPTGELQSPTSDPEFREALTRALLQADSAPQLTRVARPAAIRRREGGRAERATVGDDAQPDDATRAGPFDQGERSLRAGTPVDLSSALPLTRIEISSDAPRPALSSEAAAALDSLIVERQRGASLLRAGIEPTRTLLLTGDPGVGKTMAARFLAGALRLPLLTIDLAAVVSSFLGRTGQNLRFALEYARSNPCVLLLDEFDALAKRRDDPTDVGELKRIVNVLLLELEHWPASSLLVAATNHPDLLDRAIWRRFERVIVFATPDENTRRSIARRQLEDSGFMVHEHRLARFAMLTERASGSELVRIVKSALRDWLLLRSDLERSPDDSERQALADRLDGLALQRLERAAQNSESARAQLAAVLQEVLGLSLRDVGQRLGVSHTTAAKLIKQHSQLAQSAYAGSFLEHGTSAP